MKTKTRKVLILVSIFLTVLVLNMITPLIMDDFNYTYGLDGRIQSIKDIINYQIWFYNNWGGRNVAHFLAQFFLMNNKLLFNITNSLMYTLLIYLIYKIIKGTSEDKPNYLILIHLGLWFFTPAFGQAFIWLTGSCNYLWTTTIILIFINLFIKFSNSKKYNLVQNILFFILGIIAGWTNENAGASLIVLLLVFIGIRLKLEKKNINKIQVVGIIGVVLGFLIMIMAPGNYIRSNAYENNGFFLIEWIKRAVSITITLEHTLIYFFIIMVIIGSIYIIRKQKIDIKNYSFLIGTIVAIYSMVVSPTFPERSWTIVIVYSIVLCGNLLYHLNIDYKLKSLMITNCIIVGLFLFVNSYILAVKDSYQFYNTWQYRIETIEKGKKEGIKDYEFEIHLTSRKQSASFGLGDLFDKKNDSNNQTYARYFEIKSIKAKNNR